MNDAAPKPDAPKPRRRSWWVWLFIVALLAGAAWYVGYVPGNDIAWASDYAAAQQQAADTGKPMLLFFHAEWCLPCRVMKREVWTDAQVETAVNSQFIPVTVDVDDPSAAPLLERYQITATPTTVIADSQGNNLKEAVGGLGKSDFLNLLHETYLPSASGALTE